MVKCSRCHTPLRRFGKYWLCEEHGPQEIWSASNLAEVTATLVAYVLQEYVQEDERKPFCSVHRLADAAEMVTRFLCCYCSGSVLRTHKEMPHQLRQMLGEWFDALPSAPGVWFWNRLALTLWNATPFFQVYGLMSTTFGCRRSVPERGWAPPSDRHLNFLAHNGRVLNKTAQDLWMRIATVSPGSAGLEFLADVMRGLLR